MKTLLDVSLLNSCNFSCEYCISKSTLASEAPHGRYEVVGCFIDPDALIAYINMYFHNAIIQLSGGEPLTYPAITYVVRELLTTNTVVINTNGALIHNVPLLHSLPTNWRISIHPEQRKLDDLYNDIAYLTKSNVNILLNYVLHPRHLHNHAKYAINIISHLEQMGIPFEVTGFRGTYNGKFYTAFDLDYDGLTTELPKRQKIIYSTIEADGRVYGCHGYGNGINSIGCIYDNTYMQDESCSNNCVGPNNVSMCPSIMSMLRMNLV